MILLIHLLFGAAIGSVVENIPLAVLLAFLGHYFLDLFPHIEYPVPAFKNKKWDFHWQSFLVISFDFIFGLYIIFLFSNNKPIIYLCALIALVPDLLTLFEYKFKNNFLLKMGFFHDKIIHFLKYKKIPIFWRIISQLIAIVISIILIIRV